MNTAGDTVIGLLTCFALGIAAGLYLPEPFKRIARRGLAGAIRAAVRRKPQPKPRQRTDPKATKPVSRTVPASRVPELRPPATEMTAATYPAKGNVKTSTLPTSVRKLQMRNAVLLECLDSLGHGDMARDVIEELETEEK